MPCSWPLVCVVARALTPIPREESGTHTVLNSQLTLQHGMSITGNCIWCRAKCCSLTTQGGILVRVASHTCRPVLPSALQRGAAGGNDDGKGAPADGEQEAEGRKLASA